MAFLRRHHSWIVGFLMMWAFLTLGLKMGVLFGDAHRHWSYNPVTGFIMAVGLSALQVYRTRKTSTPGA